MGDRPVMAFDLEVTGHHAGYIQDLARYWTDHVPNQAVSFVVSPSFLTVHANVVATATQCERIRFVSVSPQEMPIQSTTGGRLGLLRHALKTWRLMGDYAERLNAAHCMVMYLDQLLLGPLSLGLKAPCDISGIYFRPTFHYKTFPGYRAGMGDTVRALRQKWQMKRAFRHANLKTVFCLDHYVVEHLNAMKGNARAVPLADPVAQHNDAKPLDLRAELNVREGALLALLFGVLSARKGIFELLNSLKHLSEESARRTCLLLVGASPENERAAVEHAIATSRQQTNVQILRTDRFIPEGEVQSYFEQADLILAPYKKHVGMSGILVRAACAGRPVLASDYGLMGRVVQHHKLGRTLDSSSPEIIAAELERCLHTDLGKLADEKAMQRFAKQNNPECFARDIVKNVTLQPLETGRKEQ